MAHVDEFLAVCGPPFFLYELAWEQLADSRALDNLVVKSHEPESDNHYTQAAATRLHTDNIQQLSQRDSTEPSTVQMNSAPVPVTRGKRGLCYDVSQVADSKLRERLLKNRESAGQSRKRKLEAVKEYEQLLEERDAENKRLKDINSALLNRIAEVEEALGQHTNDDA
jgi:hypothetical protein